MVKVLVDTSALIVLLDADDRRHAEAVATLEAFRDSAELVTTSYIQVEALAVVRRRLGAGAMTDLLDSLLPLMRVIWVDPGTHASALAAHRLTPGVSMVDRVSFAVMRNEGIPYAFAFDKDFELEGFALLSDAMAPRRPRQVHEASAGYGSDVAAELVSVSEIAMRASRSINTVQSWRRRNSDFPTPLAQLAAGPIWEWPAIDAWVRGHARARAEQPADA